MLHVFVIFAHMMSNLLVDSHTYYSHLRGSPIGVNDSQLVGGGRGSYLGLMLTIPVGVGS